MSDQERPAKSGRPPLPPEKQRRWRTTVYSDLAEHERIHAIARVLGRPVSRVMVEATLTGKLNPSTPAVNREQYAGLRRLGNLLSSAIKASYRGKLKNLDTRMLEELRRTVLQIARTVRPR